MLQKNNKCKIETFFKKLEKNSDYFKDKMAGKLDKIYKFLVEYFFAEADTF